MILSAIFGKTGGFEIDFCPEKNYFVRFYPGYADPANAVLYERSGQNMKISMNWLNEYVDIEGPVEMIAETLSDLGFPTESIEKAGDDTIIDVEVTSNRGDCLSHIGVARELAAHFGKELRLPEITYPEFDRNASDLIQVVIDAPDLCWRYTGMVIQGVKVGPSPDWVVKRLEAVGLRSVNNVVDATNYAMLETGQPSHAFDGDKIGENTIVVRTGRSGESLVSIDGTKCRLDESMLVIADKNIPVAIAGVMGGLDTEVSELTTTVLLENARFDPVSVRTTARRLSIPSEASYRFERQVNTRMVDWAARRTAQLIVEFAGGRVAKGMVDTYPREPEELRVAMRPARMSLLLGIDVPEDTTLTLLERLGFAPRKTGDQIECTVPSWRHDITREVDLFEEVARCYGYDKIPVEKKININVAPVDKREKLADKIARVLTGCGYYETVNVSFVNDQVNACFESPDVEPLRVKDETRKSANIIRQNLIGSLLQVVRTNLNAGNPVVRLFEIANTFRPNTDGGLPNERTRIGIVTTGGIRELRGVIEEMVRQVHSELGVVLRPADIPWAQTGAEILIHTDLAGTAGVVNKKVRDAFDIENEIAAAELDFDTLRRHFGQIVQVRPIPRFPAVTRDLSLILEEAVIWNAITEAIDTAAPEQLEKISFVDIYRGKPIPAGKKSLTLSMRFRDEDGTLTHEMVDGFEEAILRELKTKFNAELRTV